MGQANETPKNAELLRYLERRPELHEREVIEIKNMFDALKPVDGIVDLCNLQAAYQNSTEIEDVKSRFGGKSLVNFDEFFAVVSSVVIERRSKLNNVSLEASARNVSCFYCPFPSDSSKNRSIGTGPRNEY